MNIFTPEQIQVFTQLFVAVVLGSVIAIERTLAHRLAGFRTFAMVSLGACAFTIIGDMAVGALGSISSVDPLRVASQIVVGVGFLAGGLIVFNKDQVHGLTTSAGLWVAAAVGMAVGFHLYALATMTALLTVLIFGLFWQIEKKIVAEEERLH